MSIHHTAIVDRRSEIESDVEIGPYCVIDGLVRIGRGTKLYHGVYVTGWTDIGEGCVFHPGVIVGHEPQDVKYHGERSYCRVGRNCVFREHVTVHRGTIPESTTSVGDDCFLLAGSHVAHNCTIGNRVTLINNVLLAGHVEVANRVTMGGGAVVHQFVRIGELSMIPGIGRVPKDAPPYSLLGIDGRVAGLNRVGMRRAGMSADEFRDVRDAYRLLFGQRMPFSEAVERLASEVRTAAGRLVLEFVKGESKRGVAGRIRKSHQRGASIEADTL